MRATPTGEPVRDEATRAGRTAASLPGADEDYFRGMDVGVLSESRLRHRAEAVDEARRWLRFVKAMP